MEELSYKIRISVLWVLHMLAFFAYRTFAVSDGATEVSMLKNNDLAPYLLGMMVFTILTLILKGRNNRLMNIIGSSIIGVTQVIMLVDGMIGYPTASFNWMTGATIVILALIVWFAFRWPKQQRT
jgi:hypothetical protein